MKSIHALLEVALRERASDLIVKAGARPVLRVDGRMQETEIEPLTAPDTRELAYGIVYSATRDYLLQCPEDGDSPDPDTVMADAEKRMEELKAKAEIDLVFTIPKLARVRANLFLQRGTVGAALRIIPLHPYSIEELSLPPVLKEMALQPHGLIVITGPTGCGKTTTMAAIIEEINRKRPCHIFTVEEPIEYVFADKKSVIHQREIGNDTRSFASALRSVTRQSPDVIAIGEMRDPETMDVAMTASEIGHLVITTLHTVSAAATVDRIINSFPQHLRRQVSAQLAASLLCVTSQRLVPRASGKGRIPAVEVLTNSPTVRKQIEEGDTGELYASLREGHHFGMNTMNQALEKLYQARQITYDEAMLYAGNPTELKQMLRRT
jgi:twitching motility protein PilT